MSTAASRCSADTGTSPGTSARHKHCKSEHETALSLVSSDYLLNKRFGRWAEVTTREWAVCNGQESEWRGEGLLESAESQAGDCAVPRSSTARPVLPLGRKHTAKKLAEVLLGALERACIELRKCETARKGGGRERLPADLHCCPRRTCSARSRRRFVSREPGLSTRWRASLGFRASLHKSQRAHH